LKPGKKKRRGPTVAVVCFWPRKNKGRRKKKNRGQGKGGPNIPADAKGGEEGRDWTQAEPFRSARGKRGKGKKKRGNQIGNYRKRREKKGRDREKRGSAGGKKKHTKKRGERLEARLLASLQKKKVLRGNGSSGLS